MKNMQKTHENVLVTGGGGFLGRAVVEKLLQRKDRVISISRKFYTDLQRIGAEQIQADIRDKNTLEKSFQGVQTVFHIAAKADIWGKKADFFATNVTGTKNVISACTKNKVKILVYTSSPSVVFNGKDMAGVDESIPYADHFNAFYPETKAIAEKMVRSAASENLRVIILRPHLIWGPGDNHLVPGIIKKAKSLKRIGSGENLVDTIYIDNAADAHILARDALKRNPDLSGNVYFISQGRPVKLWSMVDDILDAAGLDPVSGSVSSRTAWLAGFFFELFYRILRIDKEPPMTRFVAEELATSHWFDISGAKKDLGYFPLVSTEKGLEKLKDRLGIKK